MASCSIHAAIDSFGSPIAAYAERLETWEAWEDVSNAAMGEPKKSMAEGIEQLAHATPNQE